MSSMFEKMYDEMELDEVICRLPGELAIGSMKRRISTLEEFKVFLTRPDAGGASKVKEIKEHINNLVMSNTVKDLFDTFTDQYHPILFGWLTEDNKKKLVTKGKEFFTTEFLFNVTDSTDYKQLDYILDKVLALKNTDLSKINAILRKVNVEHFQKLLLKLLKDSRPEVKALILSISNQYNFATISDHQKMIALKAFSKLPESTVRTGFINTIDFKLFKKLKPLERIMSLDRYLNYYPIYKKVKVFSYEPTEDEFNMILFAGCFQFNDLVENIKNKYNKITKLDPPKEDQE